MHKVKHDKSIAYYTFIALYYSRERNNGFDVVGLNHNKMDMNQYIALQGINRSNGELYMDS